MTTKAAKGAAKLAELTKTKNAAMKALAKAQATFDKAQSKLGAYAEKLGSAA